MQQDLTRLYAEQTAQEGFLQRYQRISKAQAKSIPPFYS
jgi:hypothetical protein